MNHRVKCLIMGSSGDAILYDLQLWLDELPVRGGRIEVDAEASREVMTLFYHYNRIPGTDMVNLSHVTIIIR